MESSKNKFVSYLHVQNHIHVDTGGGNWIPMLRDFKRIYNTNSVAHHLHFSKAGVQLNDVYVLIAYMLSKNVVTLTDGVSVGKALKVLGRDEKVVNSLLKLPLNRLLPKLKQLTGLLASKGVKLNINWLCRDLFAWESQSQHSDKDWVIRSWVRDYCHNPKGDNNVSK